MVCISRYLPMTIKVGTCLEADCVNHTLGKGEQPSSPAPSACTPVPKMLPGRTLSWLAVQAFPCSSLEDSLSDKGVFTC